MKFKEYDEKTWTVKKKHPKKVKELNPNTLRTKTYKRSDYTTTEIAPEKRSLKNIPKYADGKDKVDFKDWLGIKAEKRDPSHSVATFGKGQDGKWYGWSHRAIGSFSVGDVVKPNVLDNEKEFTIKTDDEARQAAIDYAESVS